MALNEATLRKLSKDEIKKLALEYQSKFDSTLSTTIHKILGAKSSFMWKSTPREKLNFFFQQFFANIAKIFVLGGRLGYNSRKL